jgi:Bacterial Ig-like domain/Galactose oxidase, central domain
MHAKERLRRISGFWPALSITVVSAILTMALDSQTPNAAALPADYSRTLMPNGSWLLIGGKLDPTRGASAVIFDPSSGQVAPVRGSLIHGRSWHSATLLPDGKVLIAGGVDREGRVISDPEIFDPAQQSFEPVPASGLTARAYHSATLLTDGTVLLAGGISEGKTPLRSADLWDSATRAGSKLPAGMLAPRRSPVASLLPDGSVLLSEGLVEADSGQIKAEVYLPWLQVFQPYYPNPRNRGAPAVEGSVPENGATDVAVGSVVGVRFSTRLQINSISSATVALLDGGQHLDARIVPAEQGMLAFIAPKEPLAPATRYMVAIEGAKDELERPVPYSTLTFTTANGSTLLRENTSIITESQPTGARSLSAALIAAAPRAAPADPPNSYKTFFTCLNNNLAGKAGKTVVDTVTNCIPPAGACKFTVTMSNASAQKACSISFTNTWIMHTISVSSADPLG